MTRPRPAVTYEHREGVFQDVPGPPASASPAHGGKWSVRAQVSEMKLGTHLLVWCAVREDDSDVKRWLTENDVL